MTQIQVLGALAPIFAGLVVASTALIVTYLDDKEAEAERKARLPSGKDDQARMASAAE